nr:MULTISPECIES: hypothetical protein [unclassified Streptomyces]
MLLLMPRMVGRVKHIKVPDELASLTPAPRHLPLLAHLLLDGPQKADEPALAPLRPAERRMFIDTLAAYDHGLAGAEQ